MCIVILFGKRTNPLRETGLDLEAETVGSPDDDDFFEKNCGKGKLFPMVPTYTYKGKTVHVLCHWSAECSFTSAILVDMFAVVDHFGIMDRSTSVQTFLLVDGHGSRFELPFLEYICDPLYLWAVCDNVPYGTTLWQLEDYPEQN